MNEDEFNTAVHMVFSVPVDPNIEIVPAIGFAGGIGILIHRVHRLEPHILPDTVRDLGKTVRSHKRKDHYREPAGIIDTTLVAAV